MLRREMTVFGRQPAPRQWYQIKAQESEAEILIYDEISFWGVDAAQFARDVGAVDTDSMHVRINSPGGSVFDGMAIFNTLRNHAASVRVTVDGVAASIASVIALAGDSVTMAEGSFLMIHSPWALAIGNAQDMRDTADTLDKIGGSMADVYERNSSLSRAEVLNAMSTDTWYTAQEAVDAGFADSVQGESAQARFDLSIYSNVPDGARELVGCKQAPQTERELERALRDAGLSRAQAKTVAHAGASALGNQWDAGPTDDTEKAEQQSALGLLEKLRSYSA